MTFEEVWNKEGGHLKTCKTNVDFARYVWDEALNNAPKNTIHNNEDKQSCKGCEFEDISCSTCDTCKNFNMFTPKQA